MEIVKGTQVKILKGQFANWVGVVDRVSENFTVSYYVRLEDGTMVFVPASYVMRAPDYS